MMRKTAWLKDKGEKSKSRIDVYREIIGNAHFSEVIPEKGVESMEAISEAAAYLSLEEIRMKMKMTSGFWKVQKWLVIYNALIDPRPASEIAKHTGLSVTTVQKIIAEYNTLGPEAFETTERESCIRFHP